MSNNKHTPGPWVVHQRPREPFEYGHHVMTEDGLTICSVTYQLPSRTPEGVEETKRIANARLIAAAPELLENLIGCMEALASHAPDCIEVQCARAAIAKAGGAA